MKKIIIYIIITIIGYYFLSIFFSKNNQFVQYFFSYSDSKNESIKKEIFVSEKLNISFIKGSSDIIKNIFDLWIDKSIVTKQYGFLPIKHSEVNKYVYCLNINFKKNTNNITKEKFFYKIKNNKYNQYTMRSLDFKKGEKVEVDFFLDKNLVAKGIILIPLK